MTKTDHKTANRQLSNIRVAFVYYSSFSPFIKNDYDILTRHFDVYKIKIKKMKDIFRLAVSALKCDMAFIWFAGKHAFPAVLLFRALGKKSIIVVGGYDVAYEPEINYGQFTLNWQNRMYAKFALKYSNKVLVVDPSLKDDAIKNAGVDAKNFDYLPTGYNPSKFHPKDEKESLILTVAGGESWDRIRIKGVDIFVESAKFLPDVRFLVIGVQGDALRRLKDVASKNVNFIGSLPQDELIGYYQKAKVYCQLSIREGLPNALCEAMLCECIPVGTERNGIPTAIGDTGFLVPYGDPSNTAKSIEKALNSSNSLGQKARRRIIELFSEKRRESGLIQTIESMY
jgi:glycosyltransferase involved in cell wall biosynthesis